MRGVVRWALSPLDAQAHLLVPVGDLPWGVLTTRCGQVRPPGCPHHGGSPGSGRRRCPRCAVIAQRPVSVPVQPWAPGPQVSPEDRPVATGHRNTVRVAWARCRTDQRLHLLTAWAVLDLATLGCALACCGVLILAPELVLRGGGTACGGCLAAGSV